MAKKARKKKPKSGVEMDMTPMIDIVFLLIIFFMVVTELTLDQALVVLPVASEAKVEEPQPGSRIVVVNVSLSEDKQIIQIGTGEPLDGEALISALRGEALAFGRFEPNPSDPTKSDSALEVTIRCDQGARSESIHKIFDACQKARIYKVRCAALSERLEDPYSPE